MKSTDDDTKLVKKEMKDYLTGEIIVAKEKFSKRVMIGIPTTGLVRIEWTMARYGQVIPCNWSQIELLQWVNSQVSPLGFLVADARNIVVKRFLEENFEWLFFIDSDVIIPPFTFLKINEYMREAKVPVVSGLYFTKSIPAEPLIYRGRGNSFYADWKLGDKVWVDGLPMGCTLIHRSILEELWKESEEYLCDTVRTRRVFVTPHQVFYDPEENRWFGATGTEDLRLCLRIINNRIFEKAGWNDLQKQEFPFMIDTEIFCRHVDANGIKYPAAGEENSFKKGGEDK